MRADLAKNPATQKVVMPAKAGMTTCFKSRKNKKGVDGRDKPGHDEEQVAVKRL